jgi:hypothetical protein
MQLMRRIREAVRADQLGELRAEVLARYSSAAG